MSDVNTEAWDRYADDLARDRKVDFVKVAAAYRAIQGLHRIVPMGTPEPDFSALATKTIGDAVDHLSKV